MSIPSWARKGALVVCVDGNIEIWRKANFIAKIVALFFSRAPYKGQIVQIEEAYIEDGLAWLKLVGFDGWSYETHHFRPLVDDDDEIEAKFYRTRKQQKTQRIPHFGPVS